MDNEILEQRILDLECKLSNFQRQYEQEKNSVSDDNFDWDYFLKRSVTIGGNIYANNFNPDKLLWSGSCTSGSITISSDIRKYKMFIIHQAGAGADIPAAFSTAGNYFSGSAGYATTTNPDWLHMYQAGFYVTAYSTTSTTLSFYASNYWAINHINNDVRKSATVAVTQIYGVI